MFRYSLATLALAALYGSLGIAAVVSPCYWRNTVVWVTGIILSVVGMNAILTIRHWGSFRQAFGCVGLIYFCLMFIGSFSAVRTSVVTTDIITCLFEGMQTVDSKWSQRCTEGRLVHYQLTSGEYRCFSSHLRMQFDDVVHCLSAIVVGVLSGVCFEQLHSGACGCGFTGVRRVLKLVTAMILFCAFSSYVVVITSALHNPKYYLHGAVSMTVGALLVGTVLGFSAFRAARQFGAGFAVMGWIYFVIMFSTVFDSVRDSGPTNQAVTAVKKYVHGSALAVEPKQRNITVYTETKRGPVRAYPTQFDCDFADVVHCLGAVICGLVGGLSTRIIHLTWLEKKEPSRVPLRS